MDKKTLLVGMLAFGLSGPEAALSRTWSDYDVHCSIAEGPPATGYRVDHTARITLIDQNGNLRSTYGFDTPADDLGHD